MQPIVIKKILMLGVITIISSCSEAQKKEQHFIPTKKTFSNIEECISFVNETDTKQGYPERGRKGAIFFCESDKVIITNMTNSE